jgi:hypothetical protein
MQPTPLSTISARVKKLVAAGNRHSWCGWGPMPGIELVELGVEGLLDINVRKAA